MSTVCDDIFVVFENVLSKRVVLHRLLSTVFGDRLVVSAQALSNIMVCARLLSRVCGDLFADFKDVLSGIGAPALGRVWGPWSVRIKGGTVWPCPGSICKERVDVWRPVDQKVRFFVRF